MKTILALTVLALSPLALAAPDPCKLLAPNEVASGLGTATVTAKPDTDQDFPACNFDFNDGAVTLQLISPARKFMQGKTLLAFTTSGESAFKGARPIAGLGDEAVGLATTEVTRVEGNSLSQDFVTLLVRKSDTLLLMTSVSSDHAASKLNLQSMTLLARRALLRLH